MRLLYIGDVMGDLGVQVVEKLLPELRVKENIDVVAAQAENVTEGRGIAYKDFVRLKGLGIDFFTGGNWSLNQRDIIASLNDPDSPIIRPANYPSGTSGLGYKYLDTPKGRLLFISLLGDIVGRDADQLMDNPLQIVDSILKSQEGTDKVAIVVNFHGDYSSEKVVIGHYLDGRVAAVVGDHWHVPTADGRILPDGTAHITDVGMCGALNSSLGVKLNIIVDRWRDGMKTRNELETNGPCQFNAVIIDIDETTHLSTAIKQVQRVIE